MAFDDFIHRFMHAVTRLGEAQILIPAVLGLTLWLGTHREARRLVAGWLVTVGVAATITTVSKLAFFGWGVGIASINFTGVSGHAMFATAIYPLLFRTAVSTVAPSWHRAALLAGFGLGAVVAVSRVEIGAHSWSEVVVGFAVGAAASLITLALARVPRAPVPRWMVASLGVWLAVAALAAPPSQTHGMVVRLALTLSGRDVPYTREELLQRRYQAEAERTSADGARF